MEHAAGWDQTIEDYGGDFDKETENTFSIIDIARDFLQRAKTGEIKNVLLIAEDASGFRLAHNEMEFTHAVGMADVAKHVLFCPEDTGDKEK